jgi:23S rRNA (adenine-N6)-dimethyltransferase
MEKRQHKQILLAQNFLKSPRLVERLVAKSTIDQNDTVYEIGAGKGIITAELARAAGRVIAIEKDPLLVRRLRERFQGLANVEIVERDFLTFSITERDYKIFANIPYNITANVVRKILYVRPLPYEAYLILQKEPAQKFSGHPNETEFSILTKPFFEFKILHRLKRTDFDPEPKVDSVLLMIKRRPAPLIQSNDVASFRDFVQFGFGRWKRDLRSAYKSVFSYNRWKRLARELDFPLNAAPTGLRFEQWLGLYRAYKENCENKRL